MRGSIVLLAFLLVVTQLALVVPVYASGPGLVQITQDANSSCNSTQQLCPDLAGLPGGPGAASQLQVDSKGNLIVAFSCSQFANCNGGNSHKGFLAWSNDKGATWTTCSASGDCSGGGFTTNTISATLYNTCFYSAAIYVSGSTVDFAYAHNTANGVANYYVDRFQITYSGNAITSILNGGPETAVTNNGISDTTAGFSCVEEVSPSPNAGEIIVGAFEPNSGPLYLFRTGVTTSAYKAMDGTASAITGSSPGRYDSVNGCFAVQPATNDLWILQADQAGPQAFHSAQLVYNSGTGNWGAATTNTPSFADGHNVAGSPNITYGLSCAVDRTDNNIYVSWFRCLTSAFATCGTGAPASGTTCTFQLWEVTSSSSAGAPTQLASLSDPGACHATEDGSLGNFVGGGGSSLTFVNGQLWLTGVDDNLFAPGCSTPVTGGNAACCPSEASGATQAACQQLFLAKYTISGNSWGSVAQYTGNPSAVMGEAAAVDTVSGNYYMIFSTCATGLSGANGGWSGSANVNDGNCGAGNTGSFWSDPVNGAIPAPFVANTGCNFVQGVVNASALMLIIGLVGLVTYAKWFLEKLNTPEVDRPRSQFDSEVKAGRIGLIAVVIIIAVTFLILLAFASLMGANC